VFAKMSIVSVIDSYFLKYTYARVAFFVNN
jgi:hypothetical protein